MKFIVAGYGFVGSAIGELLSKQHEVVPVDPRFNNNKIKDHMGDSDGIIIAVSTPAKKNGSVNADNIYNVLQQVEESGFKFKPILIKSTVTFDHLQDISKEFSITFYPEFLREATAMEDFVNQKYAILGGDHTRDTKFWADLLYSSLPLIEHIHTCSLTEASIVKYFANSFLATKLTFFNELYELCNRTNANYDTVSNLLGLDTRIGKGHTTVPGPDKQFGWGGHCFPKDTSAILKLSDELEVDLSVLKQAIKSNKKHRKKTLQILF